MAIYADYRGLPASARGASVALGNFDGLHAGHKAVMQAAQQAGGGKFAVATFEPPPRAYFRPSDPPFRIFRPEPDAPEYNLRESSANLSKPPDHSPGIGSLARSPPARFL